MTVALVLVSHSAQLAAGVVEVAGQMAPDVPMLAAGGTEDGGVGTSYDLVERAVTEALTGEADGVVVLTDLGSAALTAESVLEMLDDDRVRLVDAPFVEAAVAAAVAAQGGGDLDAVVGAAGTAITTFTATPGGEPPDEPATTEATDASGVRSRTLVLANSLGLHARPAAVVARKASEFDADVTLNGVDAASVLALMALGLVGGAEVELSASGPQADAALDAIGADIADGFGED